MGASFLEHFQKAALKNVAVWKLVDILKPECQKDSKFHSIELGVYMKTTRPLTTQFRISFFAVLEERRKTKVNASP